VAVTVEEGPRDQDLLIADVAPRIPLTIPALTTRPPLTPSTPTVRREGENAEVTWGAVNATSFRVFGAADDGRWHVNLTVATTSTTFFAPSRGWICVIAVRDGLESDRACNAVPTPVSEPPPRPPVSPPMPTTPKVVRQAEKVLVEWGAVEDASYRVFGAGDDESWQVSQLLGERTTTFTASSKGWVCVVAVRGGLESDQACNAVPAAASEPPAPPVAPATPSTPKVVRLDDTVTIEWEAATGVDFRVFAAGDEGDWRVSELVGERTASFSAPSQGWVCVVAVLGDFESDQACNAIPAPDAQRPVPSGTPSMPSTPKVVRQNDRVAVAWEAASGSSFRVFGAGDDGDWQVSRLLGERFTTFSAPSRGWVCVVAVLGNLESDQACNAVPAPQVLPGPDPQPEPEAEPEAEPQPDPRPEPPSSGETWVETWNYEPLPPGTECALTSGPLYCKVGNVAIETGTLIDGTTGRFLRARYPGNGVAGVANVDLRLPEHVRSSELWIEVEVRFDSSWGINSDDKTFFVMQDKPGICTECDRWEFHLRGLGGGNQDHFAGANNMSPEWFFNFPGGVWDLASQVWDGRWHTVRLHLRNPGTGSDGIFRLWWDGKLVQDQSGFATRNTPTGSVFSHIILGANSDPFGSGVRDWGRVRVWTSNPGW
jgi:hypothetical protein